MILNTVSVTEWFMLASIAVFGPKYLESMFNMTSGNAALVAGKITDLKTNRFMSMMSVIKITYLLIETFIKVHD